MFIIYSLPFSAVSIFLLIFFRNVLESMGDINSGLIGICLGMMSLIIGLFIDSKVNKW